MGESLIEKSIFWKELRKLVKNLAKDKNRKRQEIENFKQSIRGLK